VLLAVCLIAAAIGGGLVYTTHVDPGTETREQTVSSFTVETAYNHSAEVTEPNSVFTTGTVLDGRSTYFTRVAPVLDVDVETTYSAASASDVDVQFDSVLVIRNVGEEGGPVYWSEQEELASETVSDVEPGETAAVAFALNSSEVDATAAAIEEELGASPGETEAFILTDVSVEGTINGESTSYARTIEMGLDHGGDTYTVSDPGVQSDTSERTETVTVERSYGPLRSVGGPFLLVIGLLGSGGLAYARREHELALTPAERDYLSYSDDRSEFAEWITTFRLPASVHERSEAGGGESPRPRRFRHRQRYRCHSGPRDGELPRRRRRVRVHLPAAVASGGQRGGAPGWRRRDPTGLTTLALWRSILVGRDWLSILRRADMKTARPRPSG